MSASKVPPLLQDCEVCVSIAIRLNGDARGPYVVHMVMHKLFELGEDILLN